VFEGGRKDAEEMRVYLCFVCFLFLVPSVQAQDLLCKGKSEREYRVGGSQPRYEVENKTMTYKIAKSEILELNSCKSDDQFIHCNTCKFFSQKYEDCLNFQSGDGQRMRREVRLNRISGEVVDEAILDISRFGQWSRTYFRGICEVARKKF
jgi:hypothetical protein